MSFWSNVLRNTILNTFFFGVIFLGGLALLGSDVSLQTRVMTMAVYFLFRLLVDFAAERNKNKK